MTRTRLDDGTADRMLAGAVGPDDAPPGYAAVAHLLAAARPAPAHDLPRQAATVASMAAVVLGRPVDVPVARRGALLGRLLTVKAAAAVGAVLIGATGAAAATGTLPGAAQSTAADVLSSIGISVPGANSHTGSHPGANSHSGSHVGKSPTSTPDAAETSGAVTPNSHADPGLCTASEASAGQPNGDATVFPPGSTCSTVADQGTPDGAATGDALPGAAPGGPPSSRPAGSSPHGGPPSSLPGGPPSSVPHGPPSSLSGGPPSVPAGPPASLPASGHGR